MRARGAALAALLLLGTTAPALASPTAGGSLLRETAEWRAIVLFAGEAPPVATVLARARRFPEIAAVDQNGTPPTSLPATARVLVGIMRQPVTGALPNLRDEDSGFSDAAWAAAQQSKSSIIVDVGGRPLHAWTGVRAGSRLVGEIAGLAGASAIWDVSTNQMFTPERWREKRLKPEVLPESPMLIAHALATAQHRAHERCDIETLGMGKFALPDLLLRDLDGDDLELGEILLLFVGQTLYDGGGQLGGDGTVVIDLGRYRRWLTPDLKPRPTRVRLIKRKGSGDAERFEVVFRGESWSVLQQLFGDSLVPSRQ
ncbi:MAG: hypothetical protein ACXVAN_06095 [Polyangia bacterium]